MQQAAQTGIERQVAGGRRAGTLLWSCALILAAAIACEREAPLRFAVLFEENHDVESGDAVVYKDMEVGRVTEVGLLLRVAADGSILAGSRHPEVGWRVALDPLRRFPERPPANLGTNTTLVVVATNARLDKISTNRLAQPAHDGMAIAVRPIHTTHDGDVAFALATGAVQAPFDVVANAAVEVTAEAIRNSVRYAATVGDIPGLAGGEKVENSGKL